MEGLTLLSTGRVSTTLHVSGSGSAEPLDDGSLDIEIEYRHGDELILGAVRATFSAACQRTPRDQWAQLVPVYGDPGGIPTTYEDLAREFLLERGVKIILGCYTSSQPKAILNVVDKEYGLLCYPAQYEGFEYSSNIIYFGAVLNQNSFLLASYLLANFTPRMYIVGSDYV